MASSGSPWCLLQPETSLSPPLPEITLPADFGVMLGLSSSGGGPSCQHLDPDGDVGLGPTEIQQETSSKISLGSEYGVASVGVDLLDVDGDSGSVAGPSLLSVIPGFLGSVVGLSETSLLPALETSCTVSPITHTDSLSSAEMDEKLTSEWELDIRKKAAGFWERLSQEYA
jgi:hypothetical protein